MKKRILALLLAVCLVVGMLPMVVFAEDTATGDTEPVADTLTLQTWTGTSETKTKWTPTLSAGMETLYAKTTAEGVITTEGASEEAWNIKIEWPVEGAPKMTLKDATIVNDTKEGSYNAVTIGGTADLTIEVQGTNAIKGNPSSALTAWRGGNLLKVSTTGDLIFTSVDGGTLLLEATIGIPLYREKGETIFRSANVTINSLNTQYQYHGIFADYVEDAYADATDVKIIDGSNVTITLGTNNSEAIVIGKRIMSGTSYYNRRSDENTSDILFENSKVTISRSKAGYNDHGMDALDIGANSTITMRRSDVSIDFVNHVFRYAPYLEDYASVQGAAWSSNSDKTYKLTAGAQVSGSYSYFRLVHECLEGEPTYEIPVAGAACATAQTKITSCTICGKEMGREVVDLEGEPTKIHTPGMKTLVSKTDAKRVQYIPEGKTTWAYRADPGKYVYEVTCAVCGQTYTEEEVINPGIFWWDNTGTYGSMQETANATSLSITVLSAGQTKYYQTVSAEDATYVNRYKVVEVDITTLDDPDNWNIKLEYPEHGHPIMTLKDATLNIQSGIYYGAGAHVNNAPLTVVLEGKNTMTTGSTRTAADTVGKYGHYHGALNFNTTADVTITSNGTGSLEILNEYYAASAADSEMGSIYIRKGGNLIFDNANITVNTYDPNQWPLTPNAIIANGADITVNGGNLSIVVNNTESGGNGLGAAFKATKNADGTAGGNVTIQKDANVKVAVSSHTLNTIVTEGDFILKDSTVELASIGLVYENLFTKAPVLDYLSDDYTIVASTVQAVYDKENDVLTAPTTGLVEIAEDTDWTSLLYFKITPAKKYADLTEFARTTVALESSLTLNAYIDVNIADGEGYVQFARNGVEGEKVYLKDFVSNKYFYRVSFAGIAAKEMKDVITFTVYDKDDKQVSVTYNISIYEFIMEQLAGTDDAKYKTLLVDLLNYGTMAQVEFNHNTDNLANAGLTVTDWENVSSVGTYKNTAATATNNSYYKTTYALENTICMQMYITNSEVGIDGGYAIVTIDGVDEETKLVRAQGNDKASIYKFEGMAPKYARSTITWKFYKTGEDSATAEPSLIVTDSLENFVGRNLAEKPQYEELMMYCDAAAAYLNK